MHDTHYLKMKFFHRSRHLHINRAYYFFLVVICLSISCLLVEYNFLKVSLVAGKSEYHPEHNMNLDEKKNVNNNGTYYNTIRATATGEVAKEVENKFWESIDWNRKLDCGRYKCLFRDKTNEDVGYLIFNNHHSIGHQFQMEAIMSYKIAQYMKYKFGSKHLFGIWDHPRLLKWYILQIILLKV